VFCSGKKFPVKSFRQFSGNFRKNRIKFPEIFRRNFPEISELTILVPDMKCDSQRFNDGDMFHISTTVMELRR